MKVSGVLRDIDPAVRRLLFGNLLSSLGQGMVLPLLVIYLGQVRGLGTSTAGLVLSTMALVPLALVPVVGAIVDRIGPRPVLMFGLAVQAVGMFLLSNVHTAPQAFALAAFLALGQSTTWAPHATLIGRLTTGAQRQAVFGMNFALLNLGIGLGGVVSATIANIDNPSSFELLYRLNALSFLLYLVVLIPMRGIGVGPASAEEIAEHVGPKGGYRHLLRDRALIRLIVVALVMLTFGYGSLEVGLPILMTEHAGLEISNVAMVYVVNTVVIVIAQMLVIARIQGRSRSLLLGVVGVLWAVSWLATGFGALVGEHGAHLWALVIFALGTAVFALGETLWSPVMPAIVNDLAPAELRGRYNSMQSVVWGASGALGPAFAGLMLGIGSAGLWVGLVVAGCLVAGLMGVQLRRVLTPVQDGRVLTPVEG